MGAIFRRGGRSPQLKSKDHYPDESAKLDESKSSKKLVQMFLSALSSLLKKPLYSTGP
jgi:hypothetical protein